MAEQTEQNQKLIKAMLYGLGLGVAYCLYVALIQFPLIDKGLQLNNKLTDDFNSVAASADLDDRITAVRDRDKDGFVVFSRDGHEVVSKQIARLPFVYYIRYGSGKWEVLTDGEERNQKYAPELGKQLVDVLAKAEEALAAVDEENTREISKARSERERRAVNQATWN